MIVSKYLKVLIGKLETSSDDLIANRNHEIAGSDCFNSDVNNMEDFLNFT